jgi:hypothetical protein
MDAWDEAVAYIKSDPQFAPSLEQIGGEEALKHIAESLRAGDASVLDDDEGIFGDYDSSLFELIKNYAAVIAAIKITIDLRDSLKKKGTFKSARKIFKEIQKLSKKRWQAARGAFDIETAILFVAQEVLEPHDQRRSDFASCLLELIVWPASVIGSGFVIGWIIGSGGELDVGTIIRLVAAFYLVSDLIWLIARSQVIRGELQIAQNQISRGSWERADVTNTSVTLKPNLLLFKVLEFHEKIGRRGRKSTVFLRRTDSVEVRPQSIGTPPGLDDYIVLPTVREQPESGSSEHLKLAWYTFHEIGHNFDMNSRSRKGALPMAMAGGVVSALVLLPVALGHAEAWVEIGLALVLSTALWISRSILREPQADFMAINLLLKSKVAAPKSLHAHLCELRRRISLGAQGGSIYRRFKANIRSASLAPSLKTALGHGESILKRLDQAAAFFLGGLAACVAFSGGRQFGLYDNIEMVGWGLVALCGVGAVISYFLLYKMAYHMAERVKKLPECSTPEVL